jgi:hypothetical protein
MAGAAVIGAQYVAGKATRDAYFLSHFEPTALPLMIIATSVLAVLLVGAGATRFSRLSPRRYVPAAFAANAALLLAVWGLTTTLPRVAAPLLYVLVSGAGPMLGSGFWLIASERFDPRTAKKRFGQIGAAGTLGGLLGGLIAARVSSWEGVGAVIPVLATMNFACAWQTRSWAQQSADDARVDDRAPALPVPSGFRILIEQHYLRNLALVMLLATIAAAFMDYVFKVQIKAGFDAGPELGRFFSIYYASVSLISFALQAFASRSVLEKLGLSAAMSAVPLSVVAGATASLVSPGMATLIIARGVEAVLHGSLLRAGYEVFYTPIATDEKRAVKAVVDVGVDRTGDILAAVAIQVLLWAALEGHLAVLLGLAALCAAAALILANSVNRGYVSALERGLRNRAVDIDLGDAVDRQSRTVIGGLSPRRGQRSETAFRTTAALDDTVMASTELELRDVRRLRSRDPDEVRRVLGRDELLPPTLVPHAIRLLEWDAVADDAVRALRGVAELRVGELVDTLTDPAQPFVVRRRLARVFSVCSSQRAADGLVQGLEDLRFEVRVQCGRSLKAIVERNLRIRIDAALVSAVVLREVAVSRRVWESRRLVDEGTAAGDERTPLDVLVGERANRALAHVFTLLELILPADPLRIAFRGLHTTDKTLQGTALEYLEHVLPREIRDRLWPFLEAGPESTLPGRSREEILEDLMRSNQSILLNLEQIQARRSFT